MDLTGKIVGISSNYITQRFELSIAINEPKVLTDGYEELKNYEMLDTSGLSTRLQSRHSTSHLKQQRQL